jgi:hypothetical protein
VLILAANYGFAAALKAWPPGVLAPGQNGGFLVDATKSSSDIPTIPGTKP